MLVIPNDRWARQLCWASSLSAIASYGVPVRSGQFNVESNREQIRTSGTELIFEQSSDWRVWALCRLFCQMCWYYELIHLMIHWARANTNFKLFEPTKMSCGPVLQCGCDSVVTLPTAGFNIGLSGGHCAVTLSVDALPRLEDYLW